MNGAIIVPVSDSQCPPLPHGRWQRTVRVDLRDPVTGARVPVLATLCWLTDEPGGLFTHFQRVHE